MRSIAAYLPDHGLWPNIDVSQPFAQAMGGRETAAIRLSQEFAKLGWESSIYCNIPRSYHDPVTKVSWYPLERGWQKAMSGHDVAVSHEHPELFQRVRAALNLVSLQCCHVPPDNPVGKTGKNIDHYCILSNYQRFTLCQDDADIDPLKCVIFGNGVDLERYDSLENISRVPGRIIWSSSPDRGLHHLIRWWPELKQRLPHLSLRVFYNLESMQVYKWGQELRSEWCKAIDQAQFLPEVELIGKVDQTRLASEQKQAEVLVYPCDPIAPTESFCITALEAGAARLPMLLSHADCLFEVYGGDRKAAWFIPLPIRDSEWIQGIEQMFVQPQAARENVERARALAEHFTWAKIAGRWGAFLEQRLRAGDDADKVLDLVDDAQLPLSVA